MCHSIETVILFIKTVTKNLVKKETEINPRVKDVLKLLAAGVILSTVVLFPGIAGIGPLMQEEQRRREKKEWEKFNLRRLKQVIKRLERQKEVEISDGIVKVTDKGKKKVLKYDLENMELERKTDGKWRVIVYDIANLKKPQREIFREILKKLNFLRLQKSVYITPFICENEIEYLRQIFNISNEVLVFKVSEIENEQPYKRYFGV